MPKSREELIVRGYCCGCTCTNCPYTPKYVEGGTTVDKLNQDNKIEINTKNINNYG